MRLRLTITALLATASMLASLSHVDTNAAVNGTIRGRVELRQSPPDLVRRPNVADLGMPRATDSTDRRRSVVYLDTVPRAAFEHRDEPRAKLDQRNETFVPHVLAIVAGTTVDFPNNDRTYHNVFSLSPLKPFDLGRYAVGKSKSIRFDVRRGFCSKNGTMMCRRSPIRWTQYRYMSSRWLS